MRSIYYFIQLKGYQGSYTTVKRYARLIRESCKHKATIRIETTPGLSAQVDWKENLKLISRNGEVFTINIFLYILGYSRMKYLQLTVDRLQPTLFECLNHAFEKFGGVPEEIWFDNMKTVVDHSKVNSQMLFSMNDSGSMQKMLDLNPLLVGHSDLKPKVK